MAKKIQTRKVSRSAAANYLAKAQQFSRAMVDSLEKGDWDAAGLGAVHCAISANDAVLVMAKGVRNDRSADVALTYMTATGPVKGPSVPVPANSRQTFNVGKDVPNTYSVSTEVSANIPVIAERSMYGGNRTWGHDSIGTTAPNANWYLAEGSTGQGFETWVLVQNPNSEPAQVNLTYMTSTGPVTGPSMSVAGESRVTLNVAETVNNEWAVSTMVTSNRPVIAERAMYGDPK